MAYAAVSAVAQEGYALFERLGRPRLVAAPMVDGSELPYRMLCRKYGAELCYTPMLKAGYFLNDLAYREKYFTTCDGDRPLIAQFCANDPKTLAAAARLIATQVDAVDINFGCPQKVALQERFGAFLMASPHLVRELVATLVEAVAPTPVTCKMRVFSEVERTVEFAQLLESAGARMICVHGRTKEQKKDDTSLADWEQIRRVKQSVAVPVIANGNVLCFADLQRCLDITQADAVMAAEALLWDPRLFSNPSLPLISGRLISLGQPAGVVACRLTLEYLDLCDRHRGAEHETMKRHLRKLLHHVPCQQVKDMYTYEGTLKVHQYWQEVRRLLVEWLAGTEAGCETKEELCEEDQKELERILVFDGRPLWPHLAFEEGPNQLMLECRRERQRANDRLVEECEEWGLAGLCGDPDG
eukprot:TRINITY_DN30235_c0_g1_i1.p1 TRINITY_DN30235_c0_g1~~TRINITY_DN30235_c0_g1_i1.p1  ORF type:complete len:422 (-),score=70.85 TRINITY_DN30235_c0_g1_i1:99-1340(-)